MSGAQPGLLTDARVLLQELRGVAQGRVELAALEARVAGQSVVHMLVAGVVAAVLLIAAWLALVGAGVAALMLYTGLDAVVAFTLAALVNVVAAAALYFAIRRMARNLAFPRTLGSMH